MDREVAVGDRVWCVTSASWCQLLRDFSAKDKGWLWLQATELFSEKLPSLHVSDRTVWLRGVALQQPAHPSLDKLSRSWNLIWKNRMTLVLQMVLNNSDLIRICLRQQNTVAISNTVFAFCWKLQTIQFTVKIAVCSTFFCLNYS